MCARRRLPLVIRAKVGKHRIARPRLMLCLWKQRCCTSTPTSSCTDLARPRRWSGLAPDGETSGPRPIQQRRERRGRWLLRHASDKPGALASRRGSDCQQAPAAPATAAKQGREPVARDARLAGDVVGCASGEDQGCRRRGQETCFAVRAVLRQRCQRLTEVSQLSSVSRERIRAGLAGPTPIAPGSENVGLPRANGRPTAEYRGGCPDGRSACELNRCRGRAAPR